MVNCGPRRDGYTRRFVNDVMQALLTATQRGQSAVLCTVVRTGGSTPRKAGAKMLVLAGRLVGTIGGGRIENAVVEAARALLQAGRQARPQLVRHHLTHDLAMCCGGEMEVFLEPIVPEAPLVVCGGGHVARALVGLARDVGFRPIVVEEDDELRVPERFPGAQLVDSFDPRDWAEVPLDEHTYVVVVTRDHAQDQALIEALAPRQLAYLGLIGSRRKIALFRQRLLARGISAEQLERVYMPIGLAIGADTPEEIAVSIVAELIAVRARWRGGKKGTPACAGE